MKICPYCNEEKPDDSFIKKRRRCNECRKAQNYQHFLNNKQAKYDRVNKAKQALKIKAVEFMGGKCTHCGGVFPPCVYDFHHVNPSEKDISPATAFSWKKLEPELKKCIMLCANCHRIEHHV